jgi:hypothetical protein
MLNTEGVDGWKRKKKEWGEGKGRRGREERRRRLYVIL